MSFSIGVDLGGVTVTATGETIDEMVDNYKTMGGDPEVVVEAMRAEVANWQPGNPRHVFVAGGQLDAAPVDWPTASKAIERAAAEARADELTADPVSDSEPEPEDPWKKGTPVNRNRSAGRTGPSRGTSPHPASRPQRNTGDDGPREEYDKYGNKYVVGLPDAPEDENGHGPMVLKTWTNPAGKTFTAYKCPNTAPSGNWSQKCDAHEWPPR